MTGAFSPIAAFPVVVLAAFTVAYSVLSPSPAGSRSGVLPFDSTAGSGARRRVRNQTDSSSLKIGSSMVWSPTGTGGGCGGVYGVGAGGLGVASVAGPVTGEVDGAAAPLLVEAAGEVDATGGHTGGAAGLGTSKAGGAGCGTEGRVTAGGGTCGWGAVGASEPNSPAPVARGRGTDDWSVPVPPVTAVILDSPGRRCGSGGGLVGDGATGGDGWLAAGGALGCGGLGGAALTDGSGPVADDGHVVGGGHAGVACDIRSLPLCAEDEAPVRSDHAGSERPVFREVGGSVGEDGAAGEDREAGEDGAVGVNRPASSRAGDGCGRSGTESDRPLSSASGVAGRCGSGSVRPQIGV